MIIIGCKAFIKPEQFVDLYTGLVGMAERGVILLPNCCELLNEVPADEDVVVVRKGEGANDG